MKIVLDITKLVEDGEITPQQAEHLKKLAGKETGSLAINILLSLGVIAIAAGILALEPSVATVLVVGSVCGNTISSRRVFPNRCRRPSAASGENTLLRGPPRRALRDR